VLAFVGLKSRVLISPCVEDAIVECSGSNSLYEYEVSLFTLINFSISSKFHILFTIPIFIHNHYLKHSQKI
jgi:hypothetical protein